MKAEYVNESCSVVVSSGGFATESISLIASEEDAADRAELELEDGGVSPTVNSSMCLRGCRCSFNGAFKHV